MDTEAQGNGELDSESPAKKSEVDSLRRDIAMLREAIKEQQPSILGAVRTLVIDGIAWRRGERDFPRAAVIGAALAYIRPRVVLLFGSLAAAVFAVAQVWVLLRQNDIAERQLLALNRQSNMVEQQTRLYQEQTYALRAQTAATLLAGIKDDGDLTGPQLALLSTFGDIGFDALMYLSTYGGSIGSEARGIMSGVADKLTHEQSMSLLTELVSTAYGSVVHGQPYGDSPFIKIMRGDNFPVNELTAIEEFFELRPVTTAEYGKLSAGMRRRIARFIAFYYAIEFSQMNEEINKRYPAATDFDETLSAMCGVLGGIPLTKNLYSVMREYWEKRTGPAMDPLRWPVFSGVIVERLCLPQGDAGLFMKRDGVKELGMRPNQVDWYLTNLEKEATVVRATLFEGREIPKDANGALSVSR